MLIAPRRAVRREEKRLSQQFDVAHVHDASGTLVLPARSPYDRQMLREHVERRIGRGAKLTLGLHGTRWTVTPCAATDSRCATCTQFLGRVRCSRRNETTATCLDCAMQSGSNQHMEGHDS